MAATVTKTVLSHSQLCGGDQRTTKDNLAPWLSQPERKERPRSERPYDNQARATLCFKTQNLRQAGLHHPKHGVGRDGERGGVGVQPSRCPPPSEERECKKERVGSSFPEAWPQDRWDPCCWNLAGLYKANRRADHLRVREM